VSELVAILTRDFPWVSSLLAITIEGDGNFESLKINRILVHLNKGISFPAGSGLVAFAAATGVMPLDMPESVLVKFTG
jgi:hypothetical protein